MLALIIALLNLWLAWNLFRPIYRPAKLILVSGLPAMLLAELVPFYIVIQLIALLIWLAVADGLTGLQWLSVGILFVSWVMMLWHYGKGIATGPLIEASLKKTLGDDYASRIDSRHLPLTAVKSLRSRCLRPFSFATKEVQRHKDIVFFSSPEPDESSLELENKKSEPEGWYRLALDVYQPVANHDEKRWQKAPVLLYIHGGGWVSGSKNSQGLALLNHLASLGWVCVSVNYRLSPKYAFPAHLIDCKRGLAWVRDNIEQYGGDPDFVTVAGGSTGGNLAALMALTANNVDLQPGFEEVDTRVSACVDLYGVHDVTGEIGLSHIKDFAELTGDTIMHASYDEKPELFRLSSPIFQIHDQAPPFMLLHGDIDSITSYPEAQEFCHRLRKTSQQPVVFASLPLAHHGFDIGWSPRSLFAVTAIERFCAYWHSVYLENKN